MTSALDPAYLEWLPVKAKLSTAQAAVLTGFTTKTLKRWRSKTPPIGPLCHKAVADGHWRYVKSDLLDYMPHRTSGQQQMYGFTTADNQITGFTMDMEEESTEVMPLGEALMGYQWHSHELMSEALGMYQDEVARALDAAKDTTAEVGMTEATHGRGIDGDDRLI